MITLELISQTTLTADIAHFVFRPHRRVERKAGQYVVLFAPNGDARALSIASAPHEDTIEFITHISPSPYKQSLNTLEPGETATMTEPISSFLWPDSQENPLLIAGGVGVSSFRAIWRDRAHRKLDLTAELYYYAASNQFLFTEELDELTATHPEFAVHRVTSGITERGSIKEVETRSERLVLMSGVYSQGKPQDFAQPNFQEALAREEATFAEVVQKLS